MLTKDDFQKVLNEYERHKSDAKISNIQRFDLFKDSSKRRLKNMYRLFYNSKTNEAYEKGRNQYLYR